MSGRLSFRLAAAAFALLAILIAIFQARRPPPVRTHASTPARTAPPVDAELARCQALGAAGAEDPICLQAWRDARARFLGGQKASR